MSVQFQPKLIVDIQKVTSIGQGISPHIFRQWPSSPVRKLVLLVRVDPAIFSQQVGEASGRILESPRGASGIKKVYDVTAKIPLKPGNVAVGAWRNNR